MTYLEKNIKKLLDLYRKIKNNGGISQEIFDEYLEDLQEIKYEIIDILMWSPGSLIHTNNIFDLNEAEEAISKIWDEVDTDQHFDEITSGGYGGLLVNIIGDYIDRAKLIKPTFVSDELSTEFKIYYEQAMQAWIYGLNQASLILCCSIIENSLKNELENYLQNVPSGLEVLIEKAHKFDILNKKEQKKVFKIKNLRNNAVHELKKVGSMLNTVGNQISVYHR